MSRNSIVIRNIYVMMAYAFRTIRSETTRQIEGETFDHLHDLLAEILIKGVGSQVKRGLHHDYIQRSDRITTVRGRIDVTETIATLSPIRGRLTCEFDEYESDTPHNRALKSVIVLLIRHGAVAKDRRNALRRLLPYLETVALVAPSSIRWNTLTYHRANASYRLLLGVCELIVRGMLPTQESGDTKLASWVSDEAMSALYERFIREYYILHYPDLSPKGSRVSWDYDNENVFGDEQLPSMNTDVTLQKGGRQLIIDAKFYGESFQVNWGKETVHSANLYQIFTYVKNADINRDGSVSGLLLYARTASLRQPNLDVVVQGNRIGAQTLDLNRPWEHLSGQLDDVIQWLSG